MLSVPLFPGIPGGPELLVVLLIMLLLLGVPLLLVVGGVVGGIRLFGDSKQKADRVEELESRVDRLEAELERERGSDRDED